MSDFNIVVAHFGHHNRVVMTDTLYQYDYGQQLKIEGITALPQTFQAHFSNVQHGGVSITVTGINGMVDVPNSLLMTGKRIYCWIYVTETGSGETVYQILMPVQSRPMPEYYDVEDVGVFDSVVNQVAEYAATATTGATSATASATAAAASATAAAASETAAANSAENAAASETNAEASASAAQASDASAATAASTAVSAKTAAVAAQTAAEAAQDAAEDAQEAAEAAQTAAETAAASATADAATATTKATAAAASATTADHRATDATNAATTATAQAVAAEAAKTTAVEAKTAAQSAQSAAETAATTATAKATEAAASATAAAQAAASINTPDSALSDTSTNAVQNKVITSEITDVKSAISAWFYESFAFTDSSYVFHTTDIKLVQGESVIVSTVEPSLCSVSIEGGTALQVGNVGTYVYTADVSGYIRLYHRKFTGNIYYPNFSVKSERGTSEVFAASQKLVESAFYAIAETDANIADLSDDLENKYDRYSISERSGIGLSDFDICPSQYTIVQYDETDAVQHGAITGNIFSKLISGLRDVTFKIHQPNSKIAIAATSEKAVGFVLNGTSSNVGLYTASGVTGLSGIFRNEDCPNVVAGDTVHIKKDGTKIAIYLVSDGVDVPIIADEWVDVYETYKTSAGIAETDVGIGFVTTTSQRNEPIAYDFTMMTERGDHFMDYDEVDARLTALEDGSGFNPSRVDLFMFMGQSNMAGRGTASQAPEVIAEAGYEFRAISDPTKLYPITEPFGLDENVEGKIYDYLGGYKAKSGDMVPAFVNAYFEHTHVSIVGVSASEGGTRISLWQPGTARYTDALARFTAAVTWLEQNGYTIRHKYMLWCQGESNGDDGMSKADYISAFTTMANAWFTNGIEKIFLIKIGNYNGTGSQDYNTIMDAQNEICQTMNNVVMASTDFAGMKDRGLMKDDFHYQQAAYNEVGTYAGINTALYVNTGKEPTMYDTQDGSLYFSHKN